MDEVSLCSSVVPSLPRRRQTAENPKYFGSLLLGSSALVGGQQAARLYSDWSAGREKDGADSESLERPLLDHRTAAAVDVYS